MLAADVLQNCLRFVSVSSSLELFLKVSIELGVPASEDAASLASEHQNARKLRNKLGLDPAIDRMQISEILISLTSSR